MNFSNNQHATRSQRVAHYVAKKNSLSSSWSRLKGGVSVFVGVLLTAFLFCLIIQAWRPPFPFRPFQELSRDLICKAAFEIPNPELTRTERDKAVANVEHIFRKDSQPLIKLRESLSLMVASLVAAESYDTLEPSTRELWNNFHREKESSARPTGKTVSQLFTDCTTEIPPPPLLQQKLETVFTTFEKEGVLLELGFGPNEGNQKWLRVYSGTVADTDSPELAAVRVEDVLVGNGFKWEESLKNEFDRGILASFLFSCLRPQLTSTLTKDENRTYRAIEQAAASVDTQYARYAPGQLMFKAGEVLTPGKFPLLWGEYRSTLQIRTYTESLLRFCSVYVLLVAVMALGWVMLYRRERRRPKTLLGGCVFLTLMLITVFAIHQVYDSPYGNLELIPLLLFAQCVAVTYSWELSVVISLELALVAAFGSSTMFGPLLIMLVTSCVTIVQLGRLHSRQKLIVVGFFGGLVAMLVTAAVGILEGMENGWGLVHDCVFNGIWTLAAGFLTSGILPFIERPFGITTDMSLHELGDASHPLLLELSRRAPATHNHSMQVANIAEAACEAIGARALMTRVAARFHDIGKVFKPDFFSENQFGENIHDTLEPQMSTLIIVSHVKDGVDLAEQYRLPRTIIDLIRQHHGTSLVTFFYGRAVNQSKGDPYGQTVSESTFRYPGPRPKTKEAAVLMLADAVESACRSLGDAPPGRVENMVRQITKAKLDDGQLDDSSLTLAEIRKVENSIINAMVAIRHHRVKYPGQEGSSEPAITTQVSGKHRNSANGNSNGTSVVTTDESQKTVS